MTGSLASGEKGGRSESRLVVVVGFMRDRTET